MFLRKFKKTILCFQVEVFFLVFFSLCFFCVDYFSFAFLTIVRATKWQRTNINKASNINVIINYNYDLWEKSRSDAILNFFGFF